MTTYKRVKPATAGPVADTNKLKMLCFLFYFVLESEKIAIMSALQWYLKNDSIFPFLFFLFSSPEPKAQGELIVWEPASVSASVRPCVHPHFQT